MIFCNLWPPKLYKNVQESFFPSLETFFCWNLKNVRMSIWANVMLRKSRLWASRASPAQKSRSLRVVYSKNFSRATFLVSWVTYLLGRYLPVKQIWWKCAVWAQASVLCVRKAQKRTLSLGHQGGHWTSISVGSTEFVLVFRLGIKDVFKTFPYRF